MNCPICKKELEIKNKKVGENAAGEAIYNEFAICHDCKKQWNLDKQRAKAKDKKVKDTTTEDTKVKPEKPETPQEQPQPVRKVRKKRPVNPDAIPETKSLKAEPAKENKPEPVKEAKTESAKAAKPEPAKVTKAEHTKAAKAEHTKVPVEEAPTRVIPTEELNSKLKEAGAQEERPRKKKRPVPSDGQEQPVRKVKKKRPVNPETASEAPEASDKPAAPKKKRPATNEQPRRTSSDMDVQERPRPKKKRPVELDDEFAELSNALADDDSFEKKYSNIPPKHVRETREKEMRENYQNMLDEDEEEEGRSPIILILVIIILLLIVAAVAGYWFFLR